MAGWQRISKDMNRDRAHDKPSSLSFAGFEQRIAGEQGAAHARTSSDADRDSTRYSRGPMDARDPDSRSPELASITKLRAGLQSVPAIAIEQAAELLDLSVRTLYRRRSEFEHKRLKRHLYFTLRGIKQFIEIEQYNPTASFDITISDVFDISDNASSDNRIRRG